MCRGSYQKIPDYIHEVGLWLMENDLIMTGMVYGTYYNSPEEVPEDELEFEIGVSFKGKAPSDDKFKIKEIPPKCSKCHP